LELSPFCLSGIFGSADRLAGLVELQAGLDLAGKVCSALQAGELNGALGGGDGFVKASDRDIGSSQSIETFWVACSNNP